MRHLGAERGGEDAHDRNRKERGKVNVAERIRETRKGGFRPTAHDVADRTRKGDRKAERRRGTDRLMHRNVAVREKRDRNEAPARTDEGRDGPDRGACSDHAGVAGKTAGSLHFLREEHLRCGVTYESRKDERHPEGRKVACDLCAENAAQENAGGDGGDHLPEDRAAGSMSPDGGERREEDRPHGGRDRHMHDVFGRNVRVGEKKRQEGRQNHAAADAEKTGEKTRAAAECGQGENNPELHDVRTPKG